MLSPSTYGSRSSSVPPGRVTDFSEPTMMHDPSGRMRCARLRADAVGATANEAAAAATAVRKYTRRFMIPPLVGSGQPVASTLWSSSGLRRESATADDDDGVRGSSTGDEQRDPGQDDGRHPTRIALANYGVKLTDHRGLLLRLLQTRRETRVEAAADRRCICSHGGNH